MSRLFPLFLLVIVAPGCAVERASPQSVTAPVPQPTAISEKTEIRSQAVSDFFEDGDRLSYQGYEVVKLKKKVKNDYPPEMKSAPDMIDVSYTVLKKSGRVLAQFDGVIHTMGNSNDFGLFAFLGGETKQLIVAQVIPRNGRHWIVGLSPDFRVIYDSAGYNVGREEMTVLDLDNDGVYEITQELTTFVFWKGITRGATHLVDIVFKYDEKAKRYLPASHVFPEYTLKGVKDKPVLDRRDELTLAFDVMRFMLPYIYAGKRTEAWEFYDREYTMPDKAELKNKIVAELEDDAVYRFIYR